MSGLVQLEKIKLNKKENINKICQTLLKIVKDIIESPQDLTKRRIRLESDEVINNLLPFSGGLETLFELFFINYSKIAYILYFFDKTIQSQNRQGT